jgi:hypothetical protein
MLMVDSVIRILCSLLSCDLSGIFLSLCLKFLKFFLLGTLGDVQVPGACLVLAGENRVVKLILGISSGSSVQNLSHEGQKHCESAGEGKDFPYLLGLTKVFVLCWC